MDVQTLLLEKLIDEGKRFWGERDTRYLSHVAGDWLNDRDNSSARYRLKRIREWLPNATRFLDMGAGCATFVHHALHQDYDVYGVEPESWKLAVIRQKIRQFGYDRAWVQRIAAGTGEYLPYENASFDCVTTYQTLEHVQDVYRCCAEMVRVTRSGGGIYIRCPDYSLSTFEGHYRVPWIPGLWGRAAERYLQFLGRPLEGLHSLQPVNAGMLRRIFKQVEREQHRSLRLVNLDYHRALGLLRCRDSAFGYMATRPLIAAHMLRLLLSADTAVNLFIHVDDV